jgi:sugar O-acyltransferase (sialic acid O-acetyltransferase NeuD family)
VGGRLVILGHGAHGRAVADLALECGWEVVGFTDRAGAAPHPDVLGGDGELAAIVRRVHIDAGVVGVGNTALVQRRALFRLLGEVGLATPPLVHPRATVARSASVDEGSVLFAGVVLGAHVHVGANAVLYSGVVIEHDCHLAEHVYLGPSVVLSGSVAVERGAFLGAGAVVVPGVTIGAGAVVGTGAVVIGNVAAGDTVAGVPARSRGAA